MDSIQLVSKAPLDSIRSVAVTPESATGGRARPRAPARRRAGAARRGRRRDPPDRRRRAAGMFEDPTPHYDLGRLWQERTGLPMVYAVFACPDPAPDGVLELEARARSARTRRSRAPAGGRPRRERPLRLPGRVPRALLRELRYRFGPRERAGLLTFFELARDAGELDRVPELRFVVTEAGDRMSVADGPRPRPCRGADLRRRRDRPAPLARPRPGRPRRRRAAQPQGRRRPGHVHHRPEPQLHERLLHGLRLLRLLPPPRRPARGLPASEAGHLQEDRGDARARRHGAADAGRPPPRPRDRLLRGSLPLDQGALPDPPARALAARDAAHRAPLQALDPADALPPARRGARLAARRRRRDPRRPRARRSSRRRRRRPTSGSASCATRTGWASRRRRR